MDSLTSHPPRRRHSTEFKQRVVEACLAPGASVAGVALAHGVNANLVHRWLRDHGELPPSRRVSPGPVPALEVDVPGFAPVRVEPPPQDIRLELRRGAATVTVHWPLSAADACAAWLRAWLK